MNLDEAIAAHAPAWVGMWLNIMPIGAIALPLALFYWKNTRMTALFSLVTGVLGFIGITFLYNKMGYVKLLGLPHIILWTPLAIHYFMKLKSTEITRVPKVIMTIALVTILISLAFDYLDTIRYIAGDRAPLGMPTAE